MCDQQDGKLSDFIRGHQITMSAERVDRNPHMSDSDNMDHWQVRLKCGRRQLTTYFSMGYGHKGAEPTVADVLDCLASDVTDQTFEDWCGEMGWDTDSRKAEKTYKVIIRQSAKLKGFLGADAFDQLVYHTERS